MARPPAIAPLDQSNRPTLAQQQSTTERSCNNDINQLRDSAKAASPVLGLNGDGRLRSLRAQGRDKAGHNGKESKIIALKYGHKDQSIRQAIGQKIDTFCSGRLVLGNLDQRSQISRKSESSKAMHPFFLPKSSRMTEDLPAGETLEKKSPSRKRAQSRDTIACSTPSKIRGILNNARHEAPVEERLCEEMLPKLSMKKPTALAGSMDPLWPPYDMLHIKPGFAAETSPSKPLGGSNIPPRRKLKTRASNIEGEHGVLREPMRLVRRFREPEVKQAGKNSKGRSAFRIPSRHTLTGQQLRSKVYQSLSSSFDQKVHPQLQDRPIHAAIADLLETLPRSTSAFDKFECESQQWICKYAPVQASHVLQIGSDAMILRDWLGKSMVNRAESSVDGNAKSGGTIGPKVKLTGPPRKRLVKRRWEMNDFIVTSDDEASQMDEVTDNEGLGGTSSVEDTIKRSLVRSIDLASTTSTENRPTNAVVISGPHGCGKTAAVFAAAKELEFEVFEINAGSRRSGKDIMERVGDMTHNHLVHRADVCLDKSDSSTPPTTSISLHEPQERPTLSQQGLAIESFFKYKIASGKGTRPGDAAIDTNIEHGKACRQKGSNLKQSLVLIEEADVLFEEDKQFWSTVIELTISSRRPVVMTCTNEGLLPLHDLSLFALLRFAPAPDEMAIDYLLCLSAMEGHLLSRQTVGALYREKGRDLRASISELNLQCQMAIGDEKCGLDWRLTRSSIPEGKAEADATIRAISINTYHYGIDFTSESEPFPQPQIGQGLGLSSHALVRLWECYGIDAAEQWMLLADEKLDTAPLGDQESRMTALESLDRHLDALSTADSYCHLGIRDEDKMKMDTSLPLLTESTSLYFTDDAPVLQAEPAIDNTGLSTILSVNLRETALLGLSMHFQSTVDEPESSFMQRLSGEQTQKHLVTKNAQLLRTSLAPLSLPAKASLRPFSVSEIDHGSTSSLAEDVAPYVRSILSYDIRLTEQRRQLELSLSQSNGRHHHTRKTRASRAALEGGSKSSTRREIWFEATMDVKSVLNTGGIGWQETLQESMAVSEGTEEDMEMLAGTPTVIL